MTDKFKPRSSTPHQENERKGFTLTELLAVIVITEFYQQLPYLLFESL